MSFQRDLITIQITEEKMYSNPFNRLILDSTNDNYNNQSVCILMNVYNYNLFSHIL